MMSIAERKVKFRKGLSSLYVPIYDFLCQELPPEWGPHQGFRSPEEQDLLYLIGRTRPGKKVTNAKGGQSAHNYGCASDWTIFDQNIPIWMPQEDLRWRTYQQALEKCQARWGGDWNANGVKDRNDFDLYHNELSIDCSWAHVYLEFSKNGMRAAQEYIEKRVSKRPNSGQTST